MSLDRKIKVAIRQNQLDYIQTRLSKFNPAKIFLFSCSYDRLEIGQLVQVSDKVIDQGFQKACRYGCLNVIKWLFNYPVNHVFGLKTACQWGHLEIVRFFLDRKVDYHAQKEWAFRTACEFGQVEIVKLLLNKGVDYTIKEEIKGTSIQLNYAFNRACQNNHVEVFKILLTLNIPITTYSLFKLNPASIKELINNEKVLTHATEFFKLACKSNNLELAQILFNLIEQHDLGLDSYLIFKEFCFYTQRLEKTRIHNQIKLLKLLLQFTGKRYVDVHRNNEEIFRELCFQRDDKYYGIVKFLLNEVQLERTDRFINVHANMETAFINACQSGNIKIVQLLLESGRDINVHIQEERAFILSCKNGYIEIVRLLLEIKDIDVHAQNEAALRAVCGNERLCSTQIIDTVELLLSLKEERYIDVHANNNQAFILACKNSKIELVRFLLNLKGDRYIDVHTNNEQAFREACLFNNHVVLDFLLKLKADRYINIHAYNYALKGLSRRRNKICLGLLLSLQDDRYLKVKINSLELAIRALSQYRRSIRINWQNFRYRLRYLRCLQELLLTPPHTVFSGGTRYHQLVQQYS